MKLVFAEKALRDYGNLTKGIKETTDKHLGFLLKNIRHPSLRAKKYDESGNIWQARITKNWRFYFQIRGTAYYIITIIPHPK